MLASVNQLEVFFIYNVFTITMRMYTSWYHMIIYYKCNIYIYIYIYNFICKYILDYFLLSSYNLVLTLSNSFRNMYYFLIFLLTSSLVTYFYVLSFTLYTFLNMIFVI